jgi:hypothetical protein
MLLGCLRGRLLVGEVGWGIDPDIQMSTPAVFNERSTYANGVEK